MLMEQMRYNMLFRWFVGLAMNDTVSVLSGLFSAHRLESQYRRGF